MHVIYVAFFHVLAPGEEKNMGLWFSYRSTIYNFLWLSFISDDDGNPEKNRQVHCVAIIILFLHV